MARSDPKVATVHVLFVHCIHGKSDGEKGNISDGILDGEFEWIFLIGNWKGYAVSVCVFVVM